MSISIANVEPTIDTFQSWVAKTNQIAQALSTVVLTTAANTIGGQNSSNAYLNGIFSANTLVAGEVLRGGSVDASGNLSILSNTYIAATNVAVNSAYINLTGTVGTANISAFTLGGTSFIVSSNVNFKSNTFVISTTGRVGVNTAAADAALTVSGTANVSGNTTINGTFVASNTANVTGAAVFGNTVNMAGVVNCAANVNIAGVLNVTSTTAFGNAITIANTTSIQGLVTMATGANVSGTMTLNNALAVTGNSTFNNVTTNTFVTTPKITLSAGPSNGIFWPDNAFGGTGDTASITLQQANATEDLRMTFTLTNDSNDKFSFNAPSNDGMMMNGFVVWNSGNDGAGTGLDADVLDGMQPTSAATASTIMSRDGSGDTYARYFRGTAITAQYADVAENYLADAEYSVGTVMVIGGQAEVTQSTRGTRALGVVSGNPAYLMNSELVGGTAIALKGRVPIRAIGPVTKGQGLIAGDNGCAIASDALAPGVFAIALETSVDLDEKMVEGVVL